MPFPIIVDDKADTGGAFVLTGASGWGVQVAGYNSQVSYHQQTTGVEDATANFTFATLTPGSAYDVMLTWVELSNRGTDVAWRLYDSNGTTLLASGTVNQQVAPSPDLTTGGRPFQRLATAAVPTGTSLKLTIGDHGANGANFLIADAALVNPSAAQSLGGVGIASAEAWGVGSVANGAQSLGGVGIASGEAWGVGSLALGPITLGGVGIASGEAWGVGSVAIAGQSLGGVGIPSGEAWGVGSVGSVATPTNAAGDALAPQYLGLFGWTFFFHAAPAAPIPRSDRAALDAIADLLRATGKFDRVEVGKELDATRLAAKYGAVAHLAPGEDARSRPDQSPLMTLNEASYLLTILVRGPRGDKALSDRADRLKRVAANALMADGAKSYGGFCLPWMSRLDARARVRALDIGMSVEVAGSFAYYVDHAADGYSEAV